MDVLRGSRRFGSWVAVAVLLAACTGSPAGVAEPDTTQVQRTAGPSVAATAGAPTGAPHDSSDRPPLRLPEDLPAFQARIVADGEVTFAEYEEAVLATVGCLRAAGADVAGPYLKSDAGRFYETIRECLVGLGHDVPNSEPDELSAALDRWPDDYETCVDQAASTSPSG